MIRLNRNKVLGGTLDSREGYEDSPLWINSVSLAVLSSITFKFITTTTMKGMPTRGRRAMEAWYVAYGTQQNYKAVKEYIMNGGKKPAPSNVSSLALVIGSMNQDSYLYNPDRYSEEDLKRYEENVFGEGYLKRIRKVENLQAKIVAEDFQAEKEYTELIEKKNPNFEALKLQLL